MSQQHRWHTVSKQVD